MIHQRPSFISPLFWRQDHQAAPSFVFQDEESEVPGGESNTEADSGWRRGAARRILAKCGQIKHWHRAHRPSPARQSCRRHLTMSPPSSSRRATQVISNATPMMRVVSASKLSPSQVLPDWHADYRSPKEIPPGRARSPKRRQPPRSCRIVGPNRTITAEGVRVWCAKHRPSPTTQFPNFDI